MVNFTQVPLRLSPQPAVIGGLKTGAFLIYDAVITAVTSSGALVALMIIFAVGFVMLAGILVWRRFRNQRVTKSEQTSPAT